jgi:hypothetical protein
MTTGDEKLDDGDRAEAYRERGNEIGISAIANPAPLVAKDRSVQEMLELPLCFQCLSVKLTVLARAPGAIFLSQKGHLVILITAPDGHPSVTESVVLPP